MKGTQSYLLWVPFPYLKGVDVAFSNGLIPISILTKCSTGLYLRKDAAASYERMALAFNPVFGPMLMTDAYRDLATQKVLKIKKGSFAATPGKSNHGWGIAVDFASRINDDRSLEHKWMDAHASEYGWVNPTWASDNNPNNGEYEPWHWEYVPALDMHAGGILEARPTTKIARKTMIIYMAEGYPEFGVYAHNGGWVELASEAEHDNLANAGVPVVWVEKHTLHNLITDARA